MKCPKCQERYERAKYIKTVVCRAAGPVNNRYGMIYVPVGAIYIGKKYRVVIESVTEE